MGMVILEPLLVSVGSSNIPWTTVKIVDGNIYAKTHHSSFINLPSWSIGIVSFWFSLPANGIAFCWGDNSAGQVGVPTTAYGEITQPRPLVTPTGTRPKQITCGANYTAIITSEYRYLALFLKKAYLSVCFRWRSDVHLGVWHCWPTWTREFAQECVSGNWMVRSYIVQTI